MYVPIGQWAPDEDSTTGNLVDVLNIDPTDKGYKGAPTNSSTGVSALAAACLGSALVKSIEAVTSLYAGTETGLYKLSSISWVDVTRTVGGAYTSTNRWRFAQFGNVTIAVNKIDATQSFESGATDFADLAGAPKARIVLSVNDFVFLLGTNEATYSDQADRWWCSALGNHTNWTPDVATQCATGRLYDSPGPFTAGKSLGDYVVIFKERAIYLGSYSGPPIIWNWTRISDTIGASSHESVQNIGQMLLFCNKDGFYSFNGSTVQSISDNKIGEWWRTKLDQNNQDKITSVIDRRNKTVRWWFPVSGGSGSLDSWVSFHWNSGKWGYGESTIEAALDYASPSLDYIGLGERYSTYLDLPDVPYDAGIFLGGSENPAVFNSSHVLCTVSGTTVSSSLTTGDIGKDGAYSLISKVRNRYLNNPVSATLTNYHTDQVGSSYTADSTVSESNGKFDLLMSARWHRLKLETTGNFELIGADISLQEDGLE